jgi:hypothetical protein
MRRGALLFVFILCLWGCKDETVSPHRVGTVDLSVEDIGTTEAYLHIHLSGATSYGFILTRDGQLVMKAASSPADTTVIDDPLLPGRTYSYQAYRLSGSVPVDSSGKVQARTMDSTSHNFQWTIDTLGVIDSSIRDCAIISENDIWVVGQIFERDSLGNVDLQQYNAAHWDGVQWSVMRIMFPIDDINGNEVGTAPFEGVSVCAFGSNDVWFASGGSFVQWNGKAFRRISLAPGTLLGSISRIFGLTDNAIYAVGNNGTLLHFDGNAWQRQESGTTYPLTDIYGSNGTAVISADNDLTMQYAVLQLKGTLCSVMVEAGVVTPDQLFKPKLYGELASVWIDEKNAVYAGGNLFYRCRNGQWDYVRSMPENYMGGNNGATYRGFIYKIRGNKSNDMWIAGDRNTLRHYNGSTWVQMGYPYNPQSEISWRSLDVKENLCVVVGDAGMLGVVMKLRR